MRSFLLLLFLFVKVYQSSGQSSKVTIAPRMSWIEDVTFDSDAKPASGQDGSMYYLLVDDQENVIEKESYSHYVYKIMTNEGVQQMSDLSFEFDPAYEQLIFHTITIHRGALAINQLTKDIRTIQREQSMDRFLYDGSQTAIINLKDVRVGDIVEYSFTRKGYNPIYKNYVNRKIYFDYSFAFEKSFQKLIVSNTEKLLFKSINTKLEPQIEKKNNTVSYTWSASRLPAVVIDNHVPAWFNPYQYVMITNFESWTDVARWAADNFYVSEKDRQIVMNEMAVKLNDSSLEGYALKAIRFVQDEIRYLGFESGLNSHKPHSPIKVYNQRFGDCKDKSLLLIMLLRVKNIEAYPVLINTTYRDKISEQLPSLNAFDHCVVQIKFKGDTFYVDPTINDQGGKLGSNYFPAYGKGLVVNTNTVDLVDVPKPVSSSTSEVQTFDMTSTGGEGTLSIKTTYTGGEADSQRSYFSGNGLEGVQKEYLTYYGNLYPDIEKLEAIKISDNREENIFSVEEKYKIPTLWKRINPDDNIIYCEFYPQSLEGFFNVSKSSKRTAPYKLTYPLVFNHEIHVNTPEEWNIATEDVDINGDYYQYKFKVDYEDRKLSIVTRYETKEPIIPVNTIAKFVEDHEKMMSNLNYRVTSDQTADKARALKWPGIIVSIIALALGIGLVLWLYRRYDPQPYYPPAWGEPIGGWLVLAGIGLFFTPLRMLYYFFSTPTLLSGEGWLVMLYTKKYLIFIFLLLEHVYNVVYLLFSVLMVLLFFQRRSSVPKLIILFYGVGCMVLIFDAFVLHQIDPNGVTDTNGILRSLVAAAIWIPYFRMSNTVKRTFVNTYNDNDNQDSLGGETVAVNSQ